ncbi:GNAT family N-acetyltransferase [Planctomicrobium sp. SH664]|uniref:GNAT family N-acetyltransferase n=1 Tax=Planctomicrobium sp. SH664 TaxID=3448125 RepID=UPI003F5CB88D
MRTSLLIRPESAGDVAAITAVTRQAFENHPHSQQTEHLIIDELRRTGALKISLVAELDAVLVGQITFSPVQISDGAEGWYALGPLAVDPKVQRQGIGTALMEAGLSALQQLQPAGCVVVGDPAYYGRFGFTTAPQFEVEGIPAEYVMARLFGDRPAAGAVTHHPAFLITP